MIKKYGPFLVRLFVAGILFQTLYFKFTSHADSIHIFTLLNLEPAGRITTGILELITGILLLYAKTAWLGSCLSIVLMSGALFFHLTTLGVVVNNDGGLLFTLALLVLIGSVLTLRIERKRIPFIGQKF